MPQKIQSVLLLSAEHNCFAVFAPQPQHCQQDWYAGPHLDGESVYNTLEDFQVGNTAGVPTVYLGLLDYMAANNKKLHYLKSLVCGGAACPPKVFDAFDR